MCIASSIESDSGSTMRDHPRGLDSSAIACKSRILYPQDHLGPKVTLAFYLFDTLTKACGALREVLGLVYSKAGLSY